MNIVEKQLSTILSRNWWVLLLRGIIAIAFGVVVWFQTGISLAVLVLFFGAYVLVDGIPGSGLPFQDARSMKTGGYCSYGG